MMDAIANVDIDPKGIFKYILIQLKSEGAQKFVVRGDAQSEYHADVMDKFGSYPNVKARAVGGGRINHDSSAKSLFVYGYSVGFGRADHTKTVEILKAAYPDYAIDYSNDGY